MTKITLNNVGSLIDATTAATTINNNFNTLETAFDNTLSRDGTSPNQMGASMDMNSFQIINLGEPTTTSSAARIIDVTNAALGDLSVLGDIIIDGTLTIEPTPPSLNSFKQGINITNQGIFDPPPINTSHSYNEITVADGGTNTEIYQFFNGLLLTMNVGGLSAHGSKAAAQIVMNQFSNMNLGGGDLIALYARAQTTANGGGTNTGAGAAGTIFAGSFVAQAYPTAQNYFTVSGAEVDIQMDAGSSARNRIGWSVVATGVEQGSVLDIAYEVAGNTTQWKTGIGFTSLHGSAAITTTGTLIGTDGVNFTASNGIDFSALTLTNFLKGPNGYTVSGTGTTSGTGFTVNDSVVIGLYNPTSLFTHSLELGTFTNHKLIFITNNTAAGYFDENQQLNVGVTGITNGGINLRGFTSGVIGIGVQGASGTWNFNLPITAGSAGQILTSQGGGSTAMTWTTPVISGTSAGGDLTGTYPNPTLVGIIAAGGPVGSTTTTPVITYDAKGRLTAVTSTTITPAIVNITGLGTGVATFLATPSSANLITAVTDETGTGSLVFAGSPALTGTPTAPTAAAGTNTTQVATTAGIVAERAATKTLTNTTYDTAGTGNVFSINGVATSRGQYPGTTTNDNATAGNVGEYRSASNSDTGLAQSSATITVTIASPAVVTWGATTPFVFNGSGTAVVNFTTTGALPTGIVAGTNYYAFNVVGNTFNIATTIDNAIAGVAITTTGSQSGVHTGVPTAVLTTATVTNVAAISLPAGDWDVSSDIGFFTGAATSITSLTVASSLISASTTSNFFPGRSFVHASSASVPGVANIIYHAGPARFILSGTTTIYCVVNSAFTVSTLAAWGGIRARRIR